MRFKKLYPGAAAPEFAFDRTGGYTLAADADYNISPGISEVISTDLAVEIPEGWVGLLVADPIKSLQGLAVSGTIDSSYRDEIYIPVCNHSEHPHHLKRGRDFARLVVVPCDRSASEIVDDFTPIEREKGGAGSTNKNTELQEGIKKAWIEYPIKTSKRGEGCLWRTEDDKTFITLQDDDSGQFFEIQSYSIVHGDPWLDSSDIVTHSRIMMRAGYIPTANQDPVDQWISLKGH